MRSHRISDEDAEALMNGHVPDSRPDLHRLAGSLSDLRSAAFRTGPLELPDLASVAQSVRLRPGRSASTSVARRVVSWLLGLGLAIKIVVGVTVAAVAVTAAGTAGVLPGGAQDAFNIVVADTTDAVENLTGTDPQIPDGSGTVDTGGTLPTSEATSPSGTDSSGSTTDQSGSGEDTNTNSGDSSTEQGGSNTDGTQGETGTNSNTGTNTDTGTNSNTGSTTGNSTTGNNTSGSTKNKSNKNDKNGKSDKSGKNSEAAQNG